MRRWVVIDWAVWSRVVDSSEVGAGPVLVRGSHGRVTLMSHVAIGSHPHVTH